LFGLASVPFLWIAVIDAHTATQMTGPGVVVDELTHSSIQRLTYAVICIAIAVLPAVWYRGYDVHQSWRCVDDVRKRGHSDGRI
jgi:hypothetical protein